MSDTIQSSFDSDGGLTETTDAAMYTESDEDFVYANASKAQNNGLALISQRGDSSDEVDPRRLFRDPTLSELRYYYRRSIGKILVDKPIDDAFKYGFELEGDDDAVATADRRLHDVRFDGETDTDGFIGAYKLAEKKARRDGFALIFIGTDERNLRGTADDPLTDDVEVEDISHLKVLTIDDLTETAPYEEIEEATGLDETQYDVRETGIVVNADVESADYMTPIGYVLDSVEPTFIHANRCIHLTWNPEVDGDYRHGHGIARYGETSDQRLGQFEGDSVLLPSYDLLKGLSKGNWAIMQALFRGASHMYTVELPEDANETDMQNAEHQTTNLNAKSSLVLPHGYEVEQHESGNAMEPQEHFEVIFDQICAVHEMTKSVLFGTQSGTVSGSESDIKNYFNQVERYRTNRAAAKIHEYLRLTSQMLDNRTGADYDGPSVEIGWGPLFKVDRDSRIQMFQNMTQGLSTMIGTFAMTPDEARGVLTSEFSEVELDDLTEDQLDVLDRINLTRSGQGPSAIRAENEMEGEASPSANAAEGGRTGGREQGETTGAENPTADGDSSVADTLERLEALYDSGALSEDEYTAAKAEVLDVVDSPNSSSDEEVLG